MTSIVSVLMFGILAVLVSRVFALQKKRYSMMLKRKLKHLLMHI